MGILEVVTRILVFPFVVSVRIQWTRSRKVEWFQFASEALSMWPYQFGVIARRLFYEQTLDSCGFKFQTRLGVVLVYPESVIGSNVTLGRYANVGLVEIEDDVIVAHRCSLMSGRNQHGTIVSAVPMRDQEGEVRRIRIGRGTWIGADTTIMADVGQGCVIGAGAVVVKPIPEFAVVVGNPARIVRYRTVEERLKQEDTSGADLIADRDPTETGSVSAAPQVER